MSFPNPFEPPREVHSSSIPLLTSSLPTSSILSRSRISSIQPVRANQQLPRPNYSSNSFLSSDFSLQPILTNNINLDSIQQQANQHSPKTQMPPTQLLALQNTNSRNFNQLDLNIGKNNDNKSQPLLENINNLDSTTTNTTTCPYGCCNTPSIPEYLFLNGLVKGEHYDVIIKAFGKKYKLHKLFLDRSPYFKSLFSWSKNMKFSNSNSNSDADSENSDSDADSESHNKSDSDYRKVYDLSLDEDTTSTGFQTSLAIRQKSFELAISRLYGAVNLKEEYKIPYNMIEIGQYLAIPDIVCTATDYIVKNMDMSNLAENLRFATTCDYGSASQRIIENGKGILCSNGWECGPDAWDGIPTSIAAEVLGEDYFFVPTEWDRCIFIIKLIEKWLEQNMSVYDEDIEDIKPLKRVLNEKIHYCHMPPDQLQELEELIDINGESYIEPHILHSALWQAVQLETLISRAEDSPNLGHIVTSPIPPSSNPKWFKIPVKDETLSGLPKELDILLSESFSTTAISQLNSNDSKTTQGEDENSITTSNLNTDKMFVWTKIPPFRFSISFANVSELSTDKRVYGKTFWYAGSYWNLYLQKTHIPSKNSYQVGVYLHRAHNESSNSSSKSGLVNPDIYTDNINYRTFPKKYFKKEKSFSYQTLPIERDTKARNEDLNTRQNDSMVDSLGMNMLDLSISDDNKNRSLPSFFDRKPKTNKRTLNNLSYTIDSNRNSTTVANYEDQRNAVKVYFVIFTPSRRSIPTITSFLSVPNDFSKSQSWGWKSNNMCVFNEDGTFAEGQDSNLKFMILLGNV